MEEVERKKEARMKMEILNPTEIAEKMNARDLSWFAQRTERGKTEQFSELVTITPSIAQHILEYNIANNRTIRQSQVDQIASDIRNSRWRVNGETIIVDKCGNLNDGQHRLWAVLVAGQSIQTWVVFGVPLGTQKYVDMGIQRTTADMVFMRGGQSAVRTAAIARLWLLFNKGIYSTSGRKAGVTKSEIMDWYDKNADTITVAMETVGNLSYWRKVGGAALPAAHCILSGVNRAGADTFFTTMTHPNTNLDSTSPILWLKTKLQELDKSNEKLEMILRYWNAWRKDLKMVKKHLPMQKEWPSLEP